MSTIKNSKLFSVLLVVVATLFTAVAQFLFKVGSTSEGILLGPFSLNSIVIGGFASYAAAGVLFLYALRSGELSILYPIWSLSFVWVFVVSFVVLHESISVFSWFGAAVIIVGVALIGKGMTHG